MGARGPAAKSQVQAAVFTIQGSLHVAEEEHALQIVPLEVDPSVAHFDVGKLAGQRSDRNRRYRRPSSRYKAPCTSLKKNTLFKSSRLKLIRPSRTSM